MSRDCLPCSQVRASCAVDHPNVLRWLGFLSEGEQEHARAVSGATAEAGGGVGVGGGVGGGVGVGGGGGGGAAWRLIGVMEYAPGFSSLGKPPSMETITRDTYPSTARFTGAEIREIASGIAQALEHLHGRGLSHGDVYAHNILWRRATRSDEGGNQRPTRRHHHHKRGHHHHNEKDADEALAKLSDFGAAFYYGPNDPHALRYERMVQRAFGLKLPDCISDCLSDCPPHQV